jgi:ferric-dicitrate binding protein FerR (iron transport regulator)
MKNTKQTKEVEFHPDAWERFERALDTVAKAPPQHRVAKKKKPTKKKRAKNAQLGAAPGGIASALCASSIKA